MPDDATGLHEQRRATTTRELIRAARHLTAENGLSGFTVQDLCEQVFVSRRTFFNYFASKEDAVLGVPLDRRDAPLIQRFLNAATHTPETITPSLIADLAALQIARWHRLEMAPDSFPDLLRALEREPRLLGRMLDAGARQEESDVRLIEHREGLHPGDLRAQAAAQVIGAVSRAVAGEFLSPGNTDTYSDIFERRLAAAVDVFSIQQLPTRITST